MQPSTLLDVSGSVPKEVVEKLLKACKTNSFAKIQTEVSNSIADGWPVSQKTLQLSLKATTTYFCLIFMSYIHVIL